MKSKPVFFLILLCFCVFATVSCNCGDEDAGAADDDTGQDDDGDDGDDGDDDTVPGDDDDAIEVGGPVSTFCTGGFITPEGGCITMIDGGAPGRSDTSIALGPDGTRHVAAVRGRRLQVYSLRPGEDAWRVDVLDEMAAGPAMAVHDDGSLHIAYQDIWYDRLKYATNKSGEWVIQVADAGRTVGKNASIALDAGGAAHISYMHDALGDVKYATNKSGAWESETVWWFDRVGLCTSIAVDREGERAYIAFGNITDFLDIYMMLVTNRSGDWEVDLFFSWGDCGSVVIDDEGVGHFAYDQLAPTSAWIRYATYMTDDWEFENVVNPGYEPRLSIDDHGFAHIVYLDVGLGIDRWFKYATNEMGSWDAELVYEGEHFVEHHSLAVSPDGTAHASSYDGSLNYSTNESGAWETEVVDPRISPYASMALDSNGYVHIIYTRYYYQEATWKGLIYLTNKNSIWRKTILEEESVGMTAQSIVVDSQGIVHIVTDQPDHNILKYGTNRSGPFVLKHWILGKWTWCGRLFPWMILGMWELFTQPIPRACIL